MRVLFFAAVIAWMAPASAQTVEPTANPAVSTQATPSEQPAIGNKSSVNASPKPTEKGTTVVGDTDSPIGLFIMPWRNSAAEKDIDRPARLLQGDMSPIDRIVFDRQTEYFDVLEAHSKSKPTAAAQP